MGQEGGQGQNKNRTGGGQGNSDGGNRRGKRGKRGGRNRGKGGSGPYRKGEGGSSHKGGGSSYNRSGERSHHKDGGGSPNKGGRPPHKNGGGSQTADSASQPVDQSSQHKKNQNRNRGRRRGRRGGRGKKNLDVHVLEFIEPKQHGVLFYETFVQAKNNLEEIRAKAEEVDQLNIVVKAEGAMDDVELNEHGRLFAGAAWHLIHTRRVEEGWYAVPQPHGQKSRDTEAADSNLTEH